MTARVDWGVSAYRGIKAFPISTLTTAQVRAFEAVDIAALTTTQIAALRQRVHMVMNRATYDPVILGHYGLSLPYYLHGSSPIRRYADLVNQRQLIAMVRGEPPAYGAKDTALLAAMRDFEAAYEIYGEFQRSMERYWSLRWLLQEKAATVTGVVLRDNLVRLDQLPVTQRVPSLTAALPPGARVELAVGAVDLLDLGVHLEFRAVLDPPECE